MDSLQNEQVLREFVERLIKEYPTEKQKAFANNDFGSYIRNTVPKGILATGIVQDTEYSVTGSVGQGNWVGIPWVAVLKKSVTSSPQYGKYIIYLLSGDEKTLYLTFNQGCTILRKKKGKKETVDALRDRAGNIRKKIDSRGFSTDGINLSFPNDDNAQMYEAGCVFSKAYRLDSIPSEDELRDDLKNMVGIYQEVMESFPETDCNAWLISWNPKNWDWENYAEVSAKTIAGGTSIEPWTCANKHAEAGDDVFLIKTGSEPRGIVGHGTVYKAPYEAPHYDADKAAQGKTQSKIDVEFDRILNFNTEDIISKETAKERFPDQDWEPQSSGIAIKDKYVYELKRFWNEFTGQEEPVEEVVKEMDGAKIGLNTILYGPPGTSKTYSTVKYAVEICDPEYAKSHSDYGELLDRFNELKDSEGRIAFTTFHQSYSYEEFIEGIKPDTDEEDTEKLTYKKEAGVFKRFCETARRGKLSEFSFPVRENPKVWVVLLDGSGPSELKRYCFAHDEIRIGWSEWEDTITKDTPNLNDKSRAVLHNFQDRMEIGDVVLVEKSNKSIDGLGVITSDCLIDREGYGVYPRVRKVKWIAKDIDENVLEINGGVHLDRKCVYGIPEWRVDLEKLYSLISKYDSETTVSIAGGGKQEEAENYVFIIDEINRGNISKIFGELITLIEDTKREGMDEAASAILPYSGSRFSVPKNVYILGTMNTADRSIAIMDTALRRRFQFVEMMPKPDLLDGVIVRENDISVDVGQMLRVINERITYLFDREHTIGHAFFMKMKDEAAPSLDTMSEIFKRSVVPLLQEYFYEDYEKIQLVLGDNGKTNDDFKFIVDKPMKFSDVFIGGKNGLEDSVRYTINPDAFNRIESYAGIIKALPKTDETL